MVSIRIASRPAGFVVSAAMTATSSPRWILSCLLSAQWFPGLHYRQQVPVSVLEPGGLERWPLDYPVDGSQAGEVVVVEDNPARPEFLDLALDVLDDEGHLRVSPGRFS